MDYDRKWEAAARYPKAEQSDEYIDLLAIITQRLYHIRLWARKTESSSFDKTKIKEFKGVDLDKIGNQSLSVYSLGKLIDQNLFQGADHCASNEAIRDLITTSMHLINGKAFFEYILKYVGLYSQLFMRNPKPISGLEEFYEDYRIYADYSTGRVGDRYIKELYQSLILAVYDKLGVEGVKQYYKILYSLSFRLRLELEQVRFITVCRFPLKLFSVIDAAYSVSDLNELVILSSKQINCRRFEESIVKYILNNTSSRIISVNIIKGTNNEVRFSAGEEITTEKLF